MPEFANLVGWVTDHRQDLITDLTEYVSQETPSDDPALLSAGLDWIQHRLTDRIDEPAHRQVTRTEGYGDTLVLDYPAPDATQWVTALCHYDTVWPAGTVDEWAPTLDGDRFTGPGAFDMKTGLVQLMWALQAGETLGLPRPNVRLVLNGDEEIGSPASRPVIEEAVTGSRAVLVFEPSADGAIKTARKGIGIFQIDIGGQEAHAGLDPERGASAIDEAARIVRRLHDATDLDNGTSVNVGTLHGGTRTNVTAGHAVAGVDVRVTSSEEMRRIEALLEDLAPHDPQAGISVTGEWNRPVMPRTEAAAQLFATAARTAAELGFELSETAVGGGSDGNFAAALGLTVLDGLGAVGDGAHARGEWVSVDGILQRTAWTAALLARLQDGSPLG